MHRPCQRRSATDVQLMVQSMQLADRRIQELLAAQQRETAGKAVTTEEVQVAIADPVRPLGAALAAHGAHHIY
jgi:hypothetical protein